MKSFNFQKKLFIVVLLGLIFFAVLLYNRKKTSTPDKPQFPKVIYQTTKDKTRIPPKVYDQIKKYAPDYKHIVFDDEECVKFLTTYYGQQYAMRFKNLGHGAHKADLFRYCLLYRQGGIYLDIKTELMRPLDGIFKDRTKIYSVMQFDRAGIYQGILASPANHGLFLELIEYVMSHGPSHYHEYTQDFYKRVQHYPQEDFILFQEECDHDGEECGGLDRYGLCCNVYQNNQKIIKTRFNDYPW